MGSGVDPLIKTKQGKKTSTSKTSQMKSMEVWGGKGEVSRVRIQAGHVKCARLANGEILFFSFFFL